MEKGSAAHIGLLKTKYSIPGLNKRLLSRPVLNRRLEDALSHKLTIITAPAGYGKTTSVLKWLEEVSMPYTWLSIDTYDNDALTFWRYFCAALDSISNGIGKDTEYVFASQELFKANLHINILIDSLSDTGSDFLLVLDDLHLITNPSVLDGLSYFIAYMPSNMHLVLTSRVEPRLKLAKLGLSEDLVRIRTKELRFGTEEISKYYEARGYFLQRNELERIESYTEGWAAALVAVALSLKGEKYAHHAISSFGSCNLHIENYISEDVFNTWTEEQQDFMEKTSVLERMCVPLCEAVTGYDGSILLKELYDQNSFLVALDDEGIWFRYHHLFSGFLKKRQKKKDASSIQYLHFKAGEWLKTNGFCGEAIEHYLKGAHYEAALPLIENQGEILVRQGEYSKVISWIDRLPDKYTRNSPIIMILQAVYFTRTNEFKRAWEYIQYLELTLKEGTVDFERVYTPYMMTKANWFVLQGDMESSLAAMAEAASNGVNGIMNTDYVDFNMYDISMYRAVYHMVMNLLKKNSSDYNLYIKNYRNLISTYPGYSPLIKGEFYYESGKLDKALPELAAAVDEALSANCPGALVPAMVTMAKIKRAHGDIPGAIDIIEECAKKLETFHKPHWLYMLKAFRVRLYIDMDNTEMPDKWLTECKLGLYQDISRTREFELIVFARVLILKQRYDDASILLTRLLSFAEGLKRAHSIVEITNLLAIAAMGKMNEETALEYLEKSLSTGIEEGYVRSFVDELSPMVSLLEMFIKKYKKADRLAAYARELLNQTKEAVRHSIYPADSGAIENLLTSTEKKVLHLIINAYSNKEIADELSITVRTAAAHTVNIYKKLGVKTRTQCIKRVRGTSV